MQKDIYTVLITASGSGSRMGSLTRYTNKALIRLGKKPVISHIIEAYPASTHFVITLGHYGGQVKDLLQLCYPRHSFTFVEIDKYEGPGSSLGYSMLKAAKHLQKPFIYHASDTIVEGKIPWPLTNWIGGCRGEGSSNYASFNILNGRIQAIQDKGIPNPDYLHIGLVGIYSYKQFWQALKNLHRKNSYGQSLGDIHVINTLIYEGIGFKVKEFSGWYDTGNTESLLRARKVFAEGFHNLDKPKEAIYLFDNKQVVKFSYDTEVVKERARRAAILKGVAPRVIAVKNNYFMYKYAQGDLYADIAQPANFSGFLQWSEKNLWKPVKEVSNETFLKICHDFYQKKTKLRIYEFLTSRNINDENNIINGVAVPPLREIIKQIDFKWLADTEQRTFHGDFILDNIVKTRTGYVLLDWRNNFGGLAKAGDMYYDLAKLNHNLIINHAIIDNNLFSININRNRITCDIFRKDSHVQCQSLLFEYITQRKLDLRKVKILTPMVWLNSAPLHHKPYDSFLFYFGKYCLWKELNNHKKM